MSARVTAPAAVPAAVGLDTTLIVQLAPEATVDTQLPRSPRANGPLMAKLSLKVNAELPVLVSVEYSTPLVTPTVVEEKLSDAGDRLTPDEG